MKKDWSSIGILVSFALAYISALLFAVGFTYQTNRLLLVCEYVSKRPEVAADLKDLVKTTEGCEIFVKSQRAPK